MTRLREIGVVRFEWIVDSLRSTVKPSSWSGLGDYVETVRNCYRLDFWARLPEYVHVFCEKDAIAGTLAPVTGEFDVALSPIRGWVPRLACDVGSQQGAGWGLDPMRQGAGQPATGGTQTEVRSEGAKRTRGATTMATA